MPASLRSRLALSNLAIALVAFLLLTLVFGLILRQRSIDSSKGFVLQEAHLVQTDVNVAVREALKAPGQNPSKLLEHFISDSKFLRKQIIFYSRAGQCAFDSGPVSSSPAGAGGAQCSRVSQEWLLQPVAARTVRSGFIDRAGLSYFVSQLPTGDSTAVVIVAPASDVIPGLSVLAPGFLLALVAAGIFWVAMAIFFSYTVGRPLTAVTAAVRGIAAGDYSRTVNISNKGEIGELGSTFNHMVSQVRLTNQALKDFVANVSHDLRTPITVISGFAHSIIDGTVPADSVGEAAGIIAGEARHMQSLVDDLLQLTRLESGLRTFERKPVSIHALATRTIRRVSAGAGERRIENRVPVNLPLGWGDEELLDRVMMNLLTNAVQYTPASGDVSVSAESRADWLLVSVADSGIGVADQDQVRIFERFFRTDRSRTRGNGHSGLGLSIVKEIVEAHGGSIELNSRLGEGSTFTFTLRRYEPAAGSTLET